MFENGTAQKFILEISSSYGEWEVWNPNSIFILHMGVLYKIKI